MRTPTELRGFLADVLNTATGLKVNTERYHGRDVLLESGGWFDQYEIEVTVSGEDKAMLVYQSLAKISGISMGRAYTRAGSDITFTAFVDFDSRVWNDELDREDREV